MTSSHELMIICLRRLDENNLKGCTKLNCKCGIKPKETHELEKYLEWRKRE